MHPVPTLSMQYQPLGHRVSQCYTQSPTEFDIQQKPFAEHKHNGVVFDYLLQIEFRKLVCKFIQQQITTAFVLHNPDSVRLRVYSEQLCEPSTNDAS